MNAIHILASHTIADNRRTQLFSSISKAVSLTLESPWSLLLCKLTIGLVSAIDVYLTIKYVDSLPALEMNPIGRWMMDLDTGPTCDLQQTAIFITAKFAGNFIALAIIELLGSWKKYLACSVALPIAVFQLILLWYLMNG